MIRTLPRHDVVLLGAGHTNAHILRMWRMEPVPEARLTCVSDFGVATYSGMLPAVLAGQVPPEGMEIDLVRLCAAAGARLVVAPVTGLDVGKRELLIAGRPPLPFDVLSVGIGSVPARDGVATDETVLAIKPMQTFLSRLGARLDELVRARDGHPVRIVVAGAGLGGVEVSLCLPGRVRQLLGPRPFEVTLVSADDDLARGTARKTGRRVLAELESRGVRVVLSKRVTGVREGTVTFEGGETMGADLVIWATGAVAPPLLDAFDLPKDGRGFLLTRPTLQTTAGAPIFAVGDSGTIEGENLPKAGVYAVREGPVLWENIRRTIGAQDLVAYRPQRKFLKLVNLGDGRAIADFRGLTLAGRLPMKLKERIDGRFMDKFHDYTPMEMVPPPPGGSPPPMRCAGCGGKVGGSVLTRVLGRLDIPPSEHVLLGLDRPDDAAVVAPVEGRPVTVTADFFKAPLDDPYLSGRVAALNAASDVFALGAKPIAAVALAVIPKGSPRAQEQLLYEMLAGSLHEFRGMGATLVGGHTIEGEETLIGFTLLADQGEAPPRTKADLREDDVLVLTKPLGTGVLLAAHMRARCEAAWMEALLESMLLSNGPAASLADVFDITGMTDITGFGMGGHLLEMLEASDLACDLDLGAIPLLPGAATLFAEGIESTLAPANRSAEVAVGHEGDAVAHPAYHALFDPQTSGGLVLGVRPGEVDAVLAALRTQSPVPAAVVGTVRPAHHGAVRIRVGEAGGVGHRASVERVAT